MKISIAKIQNDKSKSVIIFYGLDNGQVPIIFEFIWNRIENQIKRFVEKPL
jgi:hypothetical protein